MPKSPGRLAKLKTVGLVAVAAATIGGALGVSFGGNQPINVPAYRAEKVIDGDTFMTEEIQYIRNNTYDAPELDMCGGPEAKKELEKLILGKDVFLKVFFHDSTSRLMSSVYTKDGLVATKMLESGWVELNDRGNLDLPELKIARDKAQAEKRGLFSEKCTQTINLDKPSCLIKANYGRDKKTYFFPGCNNYDVTMVQLHHGDQWFCTEAAAKKAGFTKAQNCPDRY